jgi:3-dehydroquinate synthase
LRTIRLNLKERSYDIIIGSDLLKKAGRLIRKVDPGTDAVVITNEKLLALYGKKLARSLVEGGYSVKFETVPDSEKAKSARVALNLASRIARYDRRKSLFIIAFGGGVVGDIAGFVAAMYKRGVPYIQIPTTLLAQVDSAIGGKTAIDLPIAKNLIGAFYQPRMVISDIGLLETLPTRQLANGLAEIIKYGIIKDARLFKFLERSYAKILLHDASALEYAIQRSARIKARTVESDEFDKTGVRAILNYGHTIGHAIEAACGYSSRYSHGESIAVGMAVAAAISVELGIMEPAEAGRIKALIQRSGLPVLFSGLSLHKIFKALLHDKKFIQGTIRLILPVSIGRVRLVDDVPEKIVKKAIEKSAR